ncbi:MAG: flagellar protein FlgN [Clostridiales bacterium]|jgi:flagellar biosynthesis/type III secretory pathway chaperone|nr:flagellar protein FlgN [Clostridiales bacterium]
MAGLMETLLARVDGEIELYDELLTLSGEKKDVIVNNDVKRLQEINARENLAVGRLQKSGRLREDAMKEISAVLNIGGEATLTALAEFLADKPDGQALDARIVRIKDKLTKLKALNAVNKSLLENALDYVDFSMNLIRNSAGGAVYDGAGNEIGENRTFFDARQ